MKFIIGLAIGVSLVLLYTNRQDVLSWIDAHSPYKVTLEKRR